MSKLTITIALLSLAALSSPALADHHPSLLIDLSARSALAAEDPDLERERDAAPAAKGVNPYELRGHTIDGGGGTSSGGQFELSGATGQPDPGIAWGGDFTLVGGFWTGDHPGIFADGFESGDALDWTPQGP